MKKIFALLFSVGTITTVFAQGRNDKDEARDVIPGSNNRSVVYNDNKGSDNRYGNVSFDNRRKEAIEKINRDYNFQIAAVKRNRYMSRREKDRQVQWLEKERASKIKNVYERFADSKGVYLDKRDKNSRMGS